MDAKRILTRAIEKAIANGWKRSPMTDMPNYEVNIGTESIGILFTDLSKKLPRTAYVLGSMELIFDHNFAKALWGDGKYHTQFETSDDVTHIDKLGWKDHLQQMVIADDPIVYLGAHG